MRLGRDKASGARGDGCRRDGCRQRLAMDAARDGCRQRWMPPDTDYSQHATWMAMGWLCQHSLIGLMSQATRPDAAARLDALMRQAR